jgi:flagellin-like hook-associated protein FlgL
MSVSLSSGIRSALSSIQSNSSLAEIQQKRLATGKKVNSALDNPANFFTASGLKSRSSDLGRLLDGIAQGAKTLEAADKAIKSLTKLVEAAQGAARQALQNASVNQSITGDALTGGATKTAVAGDVGNLVFNIGTATKTFAVATGDTIQTVVDKINAAGTGLRAEVGTDNALKVTGLNGETFSVDSTSTDATVAFAGLVERAATGALVRGSAVTGGGAAVAGAGAAGTLSIKVGANQVDVTVAAATTLAGVVTAINAGNTGVTASVTADNRLQLVGPAGEAVEVLASSTDATSTWAGLTEGSTAAPTFTNSTRDTLAKQFDDLRTQIDQLSRDAGYNGINLLNGDSLKVQFNEKNTSSLTIAGVTFDSLGLGIKASTGKFQADSDINTALTNLTNAVSSLRSQASTFGSNLSVVQARQDFTKDFIDTLETGADQLVLADQNEEAAKLLTLNTRQQLSQTALSLASQADQGVLRLF